MMHHIYHTEGIILGSRNFGESGKYYFIFTRHLGMIMASASGVRKMASKLRFILQDFSHLKIDLVLGKDFWRVTSASKTDFLEDIKKNTPALEVFYNLSRLLRRLLTGVEPNEELFNDFLSGLTVLEKYEAKEDLRNIEAIMVLRILNNLGYIGRIDDWDRLIKSPFEDGMLYEVSQNRTKILDQINKALRETQL